MSDKHKEYFNLRYIQKLTRFKDIAEKENLSLEEVHTQYPSLDSYYKEKLGLATDGDLNDIKKEFKTYKQHYDKYYSDSRKDFFSNFLEVNNWFKEQNDRCGYCRISADELQEVIKIRSLNKDHQTLTLNGKKKRSKGTLEIERREAVEEGAEGYTYKNCILACPLCNNAKSNLIEESSWIKFFVEPMRSYYESILQKPLKY